jgi:hypothetical protein
MENSSFAGAHCERASGSSSAPLLLNFNVARARASHSGQARKQTDQLFFFSIFIYVYAEFNFGHCCSNQHWVLVVCSLPCFCMPTEFIGILLPADIEKRGPLAVWLAGWLLAYFARRLTLISHACITRWPAAVLLFRRQSSLSIQPRLTWPSGILIVALVGRQLFAIGNVWTVWGLRILAIYTYTK